MISAGWSLPPKETPGRERNDEMEKSSEGCCLVVSNIGLVWGFMMVHDGFMMVNDG